MTTPTRGNDSYTLTSGLFDKATFGSLAFAAPRCLTCSATRQRRDHPQSRDITDEPDRARRRRRADTFIVTPSSTVMTIDADGATASASDVLNFTNAGAAGSAHAHARRRGRGEPTISRWRATWCSLTSRRTPVPPAPPSAVDLIAADDTGISSTDNITKKTAVNVHRHGHRHQRPS
jgi:hypothetical protein